LNGAKRASIGVGKDASGFLEATVGFDDFESKSPLGGFEIRGAQQTLISR
jgi:hypothetical protein